jgi:site-specific recombinase XerD
MTALSVAAAVASWERSLRARQLSKRTIGTYLESANAFAAWLDDDARERDLGDITKADVQDFLIFLQDAGRKPTTVSVRYRSLQQFFAWAVDEDERATSPMDRMKPPKVPEILVPILSHEEIERLVKACDGKTYADRRDAAMIRLFLDSGLRLEEMAGLNLDDVDFTTNTARVLGKGRKHRDCPFGSRTAVHLDRYIRLRAKQRLGYLPAFWLGERGKGPMTDNGIGQIVRRRGREANLKDLHPHTFRHTWVNAWLESGGAEGDLQRLAGWTSAQMIGRYARINADRRARQAHRQRSFGDTF